jgi:thioesterase domain-containing protein/acyl carrier protein
LKNLGHRIELGEIESALAAHPALAQAIALAYQDAHGLQNLGVYYVCNPGQSVSPRELRLFLGEKLPPYMVPSSFVAIQKFPLTASGKIDRNALRAVERSEPAPENDIREASTPVEMESVRIWREMLNVKQVGLRDNFFDLGGHSLLALRTINEINRTFGIQLNVPEFFLHPTVEQLAAALAQPGVTQIGARVVTVQKGSSGLPVYFMGARPDEYRLAQLVNRDRPVYLVDAPMPEDWISATATGNKKRLPSMEQIGALFAQALLAHVGKAPCVLVGYSLGGKIAFESAHSLHRAGGTVAFLLLIDSRAYAWSGLRKIGTVLRTGWIITKRFASGAHDGRSRARRLTSLAIKSWRLLIWQLSSFPTAVKYRLDILRHRRNSATEADQPTAAPSGYFDTNGKPIGMWIVYRMAHLVGQRWRPSPLDTAGALIRGRSDVDVLEGYDRALGWRKLFRRGFDVLQSEGNHSTILWEEHAASLSAQINALLDRYGIVNPENACAGIEVAPDSLGGERRIGQRVRSTEASDYQLASAAKGS